MNARTDTARPSRASAVSPIADVAVVGGGIVGAAAALGAAQAGLSTVWVAGRSGSSPASATTPSSPADERDLRVYALSPATRRFLENLRVWSQLDASRIAPVFEMQIYGDRAGRSAVRFDAYEAATERLATIVEHRELARVLETAAAYFPGIERIDDFASRIVAGDESVAIDTERGERQARLVIAADGAQSATRAAAAIATTGRPYRQRAIVGNFACAHPHGGTAFQWFTEDGVIALLPLASSDDRAAMSLVWSAPDAFAEPLIAEGAAAIAARLSTICAAQPASAIGPLTSLGPLADFPLALQSATRMIGPRTALVGDAAHVIHPLAGQGLNLGFGDVEALLAIVAGRPSFRDCGDAHLLRRYERERAEPVMAMRRMTDGLARLFALEGAPIGRLRGAGMRTLDRLKPLKRLLMQQAAGGRPGGSRE